MTSTEFLSLISDRNLLLTSSISQVYEAINRFDGLKFIVISEDNNIAKTATEELDDRACFISYEDFLQHQELFHPKLIYISHFLSNCRSEEEVANLLQICCQTNCESLVIRDNYYDSDDRFQELGFKTFSSNLDSNRIRLNIDDYYRFLSKIGANSLSVFGYSPILSTKDSFVLPLDAPNNFWHHKDIKLSEKIQAEKQIKDIDFLAYKFTYIVADLKKVLFNNYIQMEDAQLIRFYQLKNANTELAKNILVNPPIQLSQQLFDRESLKKHKIQNTVIVSKHEFTSSIEINIDSDRISSIDLIAHRKKFLDNFTVPNVYIAEIENGLVVPPHYNVMTSDGKAIQESFHLSGVKHLANFLTSKENIEVINNRVVREFNAANDLKYYLLSNRGFQNYYHWNIECLASAALLTAIPNPENICVLLPPLQPWQKRSLELAGLDKYQTQPIGTKIKEFSKLLYPSLLSGQYGFNPWTGIEPIFQKIKRNCLSDRTKLVNKSIYVARLDSSRRQLINEELLMEKLAKIGFSIVIPGKLSLDEQIVAFSSAKVVVAPHGAGLTNIVYCSPNTLVYELFPENYINTCFFKLAQIFNLNYCADIVQLDESEIQKGDGRHDVNWSVDIDRILAKVESICEKEVLSI
jgi:capsular polysaccharide biosynthesis protein